MRFDPRWIVVDLLGLAAAPEADLTIHSVGGVPCERTLRRAMQHNDTIMDREAATQFAAYVRGIDLNEPEQHVQMSGRHIAHHLVQHTDHGPLAAAVWMHPDPPGPRQLLNSWVLDLDELTTVTAGDDVSVLGDGREVGEERPIQDLWRFLTPNDAAALVGRYREAVNGEDGKWMSIEWSTTPPDDEPLHVFSGGRLEVDGKSRRIVGTSVVLTERTKAPHDLFGPLVRFAGITVAIVNRRAKAAVTSVGADAPLSYSALRHLVSDHDLWSEDPFRLELDQVAFEAQVVPLAGDDDEAAAVMLRRTPTS